MIIRNSLRAIALTTSCLVPMVAFADDLSLASETAPPVAAAPPPAAPLQISGFAGIGLMGVFGHNPDQAGRYTGLNTNGLDVAITDFDVLGRSAWNSGGVRHYELSGNNLIFQTGNTFASGVSNNTGMFQSDASNKLVNSGAIGFEAGDQGLWGVGVNYESITYTGNVVDSIYTVNNGQATLNPGLTPFGGATPGHRGTFFSATTGTPSTPAGAQASVLSGGMLPEQTGTRRDIIGGTFNFIWNNWTFTGAIRHEHKEGSMEESFDGPYGGTAFGMPVDYDTDRYDAIASYNTRAFQSILQYTFSHFTDNNLFVSLPYPTSNTAAPFQRTAAYSLPPSNDAHYITVMLADNDLIPKTRLNLNARFGLELQNDTFAPNTADPGGANLTGANLTGLNSQLQGTNGSSPSMMAEVYQIKVSAASRPLPNVDTRVYYGIDGRSVSLNQYEVFTGGTGGAGADSTPGGTGLFVVPQDWQKQNAGAEVGYRIDPANDTKVTAGYRYDSTDRSNAQVGHNRTNSGTIALSSQLGSDMDGKISLIYADRTGSLNYLGPWAFLGQGPSYSGAYYQAPMSSEAVNIRADYTPTPTISSGAFIQFKNENYHYSDATTENGGTLATLPLTGEGQGIKQDYTLTLGPDVNFRPSKTLNVHIFYTFEMLFYDNFGNGACSTAAEAATAACAGTAGFFENKDTSTTHTAGISGEWQLSEKLKLRGDYTISYGTVMFGQFNGVFVPTPTASYQNVSNYPDINSLMNNVRLTATYQLQPNIELVTQAVYTQYHNNDWDNNASSVVVSGTAAAPSVLLTPGYGFRDYSVAALMAGVRIRF